MTAGATCECARAGFCARRNAVMSGLHFRKCQSGQVESLDTLYANRQSIATPESKPVLISSRGEPVATRIPTNEKPREKVGTALAAKIAGLSGVGGIGCAKCKKLAAQMDQWGIAGCQQKRDEIVDKLVAARPTLEAALAENGNTWKAKAIHYAPESALMIGANWLLDQAIETARAESREMKSGKHYSNHQTGRESIDFAPSPLWSSDVRHLTYHVFPTRKHDGWKWNLEQLSRRWWLFNGTKVVGLAIDSNTVAAETVIEFADSLGICFDKTVIRPNHVKLREVETWVPMLEQLNLPSLGPDSVVFSAHAKGVRHDGLTDALAKWTELMYRTCLDDWGVVEEHLSRYVATGSFKRYGMFNTAGNKRWHYSGTYFWWRAAEIAKHNWRSVDQKFFGTESWLGKMLYQNQAGCLFHDNCGDLYKQNYWDETVWPDWLKSNWAAVDSLAARDG